MSKKIIDSEYPCHAYYMGRIATARPSWNILECLDGGDEKRAQLFTAVGRALSDWEDAELGLVRLYAALWDKPEPEIPKFTAYSSAIGFRGRADLLQAAAKQHFSVYPDQEIECRFERLIHAATQLSIRRNDIAHGVARKTYFTIGNSDIVDQLTVRWLLIPCFYMGRRFTADGPTYAYSSLEIRQYVTAFGELKFYSSVLRAAIKGARMIIIDDGSQHVAFKPRDKPPDYGY